MRAKSEEEISKLSERVQHLQKLYENQELIISKNKQLGSVLIILKRTDALTRNYAYMDLL